MYYEKWTFVVVPNIQQLEWKDPLLQILYVWMCKFSNEEWLCYPSIHRLSIVCWCSETTIKNKIKDLQDIWIIERNRRYKDNVEITSEYKIRVGQEMTHVGQEVYTELNPLIIIKEKSEIVDLLGEEDTDKYKNHLICLWNMIELGYKIEKDRSSVLSNIERVKDKAEIYWYRMIDWNYDWNTLRQKFDRWKEWHIAKKDKIDNYKNSVITFLAPSDFKKWWKQKK